MRRIHVVVGGGRVHGVFFRVTCAERARTSGLAGWVRNMTDGRVEAEFEGPDVAIASMIDWCREGPPGAEVRAVDVRDAPADGAPGFRITG